MFARLVSVVPLDTFAVAARRVPAGVTGATVTARANRAVAPTVRLDRVQLTVPFPPTGGAAHDQPAGATSPANVVQWGISSPNTTFCASLGPALVRTAV